MPLPPKRNTNDFNKPNHNGLPDIKPDNYSLPDINMVDSKPLQKDQNRYSKTNTTQKPQRKSQEKSNATSNNLQSRTAPSQRNVNTTARSLKGATSFDTEGNPIFDFVINENEITGRAMRELLPESCRKVR